MRYRDLVENAEVAFFRSTPPGHILWGNRAFVRMVGYASLAELLEANPSALDFWVERSHRDEFLQRLQQTGAVSGFATQIRPASGEPIWIAVNARAVRDAEGDVVAIEGSFWDISDLKQAEVAAGESEERYRTLVEEAADAIFVADRPGGRFVEVNRSACALLGYSRDELLTLSVPDLVPREDQEAEPLPLDELGAGRAVIRESRFRRKDGSLAHVEGSAKVLPDGRLQGIVRDVSDRKRTEEELRRREAILAAVAFGAERLLGPGSWEDDLRDVLSRLAEATEAARVVLIGIDTSTNTLESRVVHEWATVGLRPLGTGGGNVPIHAPGFGPWAQTLPAGVTVCETSQELPEGARRFLDWSGLGSVAAVPLFVGGRLSHVLTFGNARAERTWSLAEADALSAAAKALQAAIQRRQAVQALQASEERFRVLLEASPNAIVAVDRDGRVVLANRQTEHLLGYPPEELAGTSVDLLVPERLRDGHARLRQTYLSNPTRRELGAGRELLARRRDGHEIPVEIGLSPVETPDGPVVVATVVDISERRRLEAQFYQAQKMEAVGRLAGGIAHDFNNLLTAIGGYAQLVLVDLAADDPRRVDLQQIVEATQRAAALTRQLLAFGRRQLLQPQVLDLTAIVGEFAPIMRRVIGEDVDLATVLAPELGHVLADPGQLEQVLMNLAVNARDAMPEGGVLTLETTNAEIDEAHAQQLALMAPGAYVQLAVSDTGVGMTREVQEHLFEPFFTTKEEGKGTGLGLATVHGIVKQSGGSIWIDSEPGKGATFKIYLPRVNAEAEPYRPRAAASPVATGSETVLVAEDDAAVREIVVRGLEGSGYRVLSAANGAEALALAADRAQPIDLLLTDLVMPGMSGRQLAERIRTDRPALRVLYASGHADRAIIPDAGLEAGARFLAKPFSADTVVRTVREVLDAPYPHGAPAET